MATETDDQTLAGAIDDLARRGFTESLAVVGNEFSWGHTRRSSSGGRSPSRGGRRGCEKPRKSFERAGPNTLAR